MFDNINRCLDISGCFTECYTYLNLQILNKSIWFNFCIPFTKFIIMKKIFTFIIIICLSANLFSQSVKKVSAFDNTEYTSSGIIGITDNCVYEYSWYYDMWLSFPTEGLNEVEGEIKIDDLSTCNNYSHNPSGIYVISDTSVHVYNYYAEFWYALYNTGLERIDDIVQISDLSVRYDTEYEDEDVFVKSGEHIYYYEWYTQQWYPLTNDGLSTKSEIHHDPIKSSIYPNPVQLNSNIAFTLPESYNSDIDIAVFSEDGKLVKELHLDDVHGGENTIKLNAEEFKPGIYFYEIKGVNFSHVKKFIKFE